MILFLGNHKTALRIRGAEVGSPPPPVTSSSQRASSPLQSPSFRFRVSNSGSTMPNEEYLNHDNAAPSHALHCIFSVRIRVFRHLRRFLDHEALRSSCM